MTNRAALARRLLSLVFVSVLAAGFVVAGPSAISQAAARVYTYNGGVPEVFSVPTGVTLISIRALGGGGSSLSPSTPGGQGGPGGSGATVTTYQTVTPGTVLSIKVGGGAAARGAGGAATAIVGPGVAVVAGGGGGSGNFNHVATHGGSGAAAGTVAGGSGDPDGDSHRAGGGNSDGAGTGGVGGGAGGGAGGAGAGDGANGATNNGGGGGGSGGGAGGSYIDTGTGFVYPGGASATFTRQTTELNGGGGAGFAGGGGYNGGGGYGGGGGGAAQGGGGAGGSFASPGAAGQVATTFAPGANGSAAGVETAGDGSVIITTLVPTPSAPAVSTMVFRPGNRVVFVGVPGAGTTSLQYRRKPASGQRHRYSRWRTGKSITALGLLVNLDRGAWIQLRAVGGSGASRPTTLLARIVRSSHAVSRGGVSRSCRLPTIGGLVFMAHRRARLDIGQVVGSCVQVRTSVSTSSPYSPWHLVARGQQSVSSAPLRLSRAGRIQLRAASRSVTAYVYYPR